MWELHIELYNRRDLKKNPQGRTGTDKTKTEVGSIYSDYTAICNTKTLLTEQGGQISGKTDSRALHKNIWNMKLNLAILNMKAKNNKQYNTIYIIIFY